MISHRCPAGHSAAVPDAPVPPLRVRTGRGCRHFRPEPAGSLGGRPGKTRRLRYRLCCACLALPAQERTPQVEGALAATLVGRNNEAMDTLSNGMLPRPTLRLVTMEVLGIRAVGRNQRRALELDQRLSPVEDLALGQRAERNVPWASALGPRRLEDQAIPMVGLEGFDFQRLLSA